MDDSKPAPPETAHTENQDSTTPPPKDDLLSANSATLSDSDVDSPETFEDATTDMTPRPTSHSDRSRSRSLLSQRTSSSSTGKDAPADSTHPNTDAETS